MVNKIVKENPSTDIFLLERSVISDRYLFASMLQEDNFFTPLQKIMYDYWCETWDKFLPFSSPNLFIYLAPSVEESMKRIKSRNRSGEVVSLDYQEKLFKKHEDMFSKHTVPMHCDTKYKLVQTDVCSKQGQEKIFTPVLQLYVDCDYRNDDNHQMFKDIQTLILEKNLCN
jgi:deoxyadenosine/deoxycytidine kinase